MQYGIMCDSQEKEEYKCGKHSSEDADACSVILFFRQVRFVMDDDTTLADLLALNLHNYEDQVLEIVDKATKEMAMEKVFTFFSLL